MGTQEVKLERAGEKSAVDSLDPVCSNIMINHSTRHYMNRRELESDQG